MFLSFVTSQPDKLSVQAPRERVVGALRLDGTYPVFRLEFWLWESWGKFLPGRVPEHFKCFSATWGVMGGGTLAPPDGYILVTVKMEAGELASGRDM